MTRASFVIVLLAVTGCAFYPMRRTDARQPSRELYRVQYAKPISGYPGFVTSPYASSNQIDVRGYARGTRLQDPGTGKIFLVP
jgi:hypothetical protein